MAVARPAWWDDAMCRAYPELDWFPNPNDRAAVAAVIEVCLECSARQPCRDAARANGERFGVWGAVVMVPRPEPGAPAPTVVCSWCGDQVRQANRGGGGRVSCGAIECRRASGRERRQRHRAKAG